MHFNDTYINGYSHTFEAVFSQETTQCYPWCSSSVIREQTQLYPWRSSFLSKKTHNTSVRHSALHKTYRQYLLPHARWTLCNKIDQLSVYWLFLWLKVILRSQDEQGTAYNKNMVSNNDKS